jgi:IMP dehydrogenase
MAIRGVDLDELSLVPTRRTRDRALVDLGWELDAYQLGLPLMSAPLDAVTSPATAAAVGALGGLGVLNLEGLWTRYEDPAEVLAEIATLTPGPAATARLQQLYAEPVREDLIGRRVDELAAAGYAAGSLTPQKVERYHGAALEAGLDVLVVQGVAVTAQHVTGSQAEAPLDLKSFTARYDIPVVVGGVASGPAALHLMRTGAVGIIAGIGRSSVSTTHRALGIGMPRATAIAEVAAARNRYHLESGRYVQVIASGGLRTGGDVAKAIACGADAVMVGRALAAAEEAPGSGTYWGLSAAHHELPRGRFERIETLGTLAQLLTGPAHRDDGTVNLFGGLQRAMAVCGAERLRDLQQVTLAVGG